MATNNAIRHRRWRARQKRDELRLTIAVNKTRLIAVLQDTRLVGAEPTIEELATVVAKWLEQELTRYEQKRWPES